MSCRPGDLILLTPPTHDGFTLALVAEVDDEGLATVAETKSGARVEAPSDSDLYGYTFTSAEMTGESASILAAVPERFYSVAEAREALRPYRAQPEPRP